MSATTYRCTLGLADGRRWVALIRVGGDLPVGILERALLRGAVDSLHASTTGVSAILRPLPEELER